MSSNTFRAAAVFIVLVTVGVAGRYVFLERPGFYTPNFTPTVAVALFAGFYFRRLGVAMLVPLSVMAISNLWHSGYASWGVMATVYASLCFPVLLRNLIRQPGKSWQSTALRIVTGVLAPSLLFFVTTNLAVWCFQSIYPHTAAGLATCYLQAVPFYRWFLQGDLLFVPMVFGTYAAVRYAVGLWQAKREATVVLAPMAT